MSYGPMDSPGREQTRAPGLPAPELVGDSDLLQPSLAEHHDAASFDRPWNPSTLALLTFFFGLATGGALLALNFERLGMNVRKGIVLLVTGVVTVVLLGISVWLYASGVLDQQDITHRQGVRLGIRVTSVVCALVLVSMQRARFRLYRMGDAPNGRLLVPALAAIGGGLLFNFLVTMGWWQLLYRTN